MNINSNNYENFFLLYADDELNAEERALVEKFVEQHPSFKEELYILTQTKLPKENTLIYPHKADLFKHANINPINESNYNEYFLLYTDDELNAKDKKLVEAFTTLHKEKEAELYLLQCTKATPENIVFKDKSLLYRTQKSYPRRTYIRWISIAAAASVLLTGIAVWTNNNNNNNNKTSAASQISFAPVDKNNAKETQQQQQTLIKQQPAGYLNNIVVEKNNNITKPGKIEHIKNTVDSKTTFIETTNNTIEEKNADILSNKYSIETINNNINDNTTTLHDIAKFDDELKPLDINQQAKEKKLLQQETMNNENIVFLDTDNNEKKRKLRGLLRKTSRFIEHLTNADDADDKPVVRIAAFEIAKK
jgi:hypothetical protein